MKAQIKKSRGKHFQVWMVFNSGSKNEMGLGTQKGPGMLGKAHAENTEEGENNLTFLFS